MIFEVQRKLTDLNKRVFDLENLLAKFQPAETILEALEPPPWLPWQPPPEVPHALGGPRHTGVGDGLERDGTDLRVDEDASFSWTALHSFAAGITLTGATEVNIITVPDNVTRAMHVVDAGGIEYFRIISTDTQPAVVFNGVGADIDFRIKTAGEPDAFVVRGSDGLVSTAKAIYAAEDTNVASHFGRAAIGWAYYDDVATFAHVDHNSQTGYALGQSHLGDTYLNAVDGRVLYLMVNGVQRIVIKGSEVIFNEGGEDVDHRWEASGEANALFIRGSDGYVCVGGDNPDELFTVQSSTADTAHILAKECAATANPPDVFFYKGRGTCSSPTDVAVDDYLGHVGFKGYRNDGWRLGAAIHSRVEALGTSTVRAGILFSTVNDDDTYGERVRIDRNGKVFVTEGGTQFRLRGTKQISITIPDPEVGSYCQIYIGLACTVTGFYGNTIGGTSCAVNVEECGTLGSSGVDILSSDMVADANGESVTSGFNNATLAAGHHLVVDVSAVTGTVSEVNITLTVRLV